MTEKIKQWTEPELLFKIGTQERIVDPRVGLDKYGPFDYNNGERKFNEVRLACISKETDLQRMNILIQKLSNKYRPKGMGSQVEYKGFSEIYKTNVKPFLRETTGLMANEEIAKVLNDKDPFQSIVNLYQSKIQEVQNRAKGKYDVLMIQVPRDFDNYQISDGRDLRCYIKVLAVRKDIKTQIVTEKVLNPWDDCDNMWHLSVGLYTKAGGVPWTVRELSTSLCFIGIAYGIKQGGAGQSILSGLAEVFDEYGKHVSMYTINCEAFGKDFTLETDRGYHLGKDKMKTLIENVIGEYRKAIQTSPKNVIIHKTTYFNQNEKEGVEEALEKDGTEYDLVYIQGYSSQRFLTAGRYPPERGTFWKKDDLTGILYTSGYVDEYRTYPGAGSPIPLELHKDQGNTKIDILGKQVLALTKMDWNSASLMLRNPVTTKYAARVVDVLKAGLQADELVKDIRYYM